MRNQKVLHVLTAQQLEIVKKYIVYHPIQSISSKVYVDHGGLEMLSITLNTSFKA